MPKEEASVLPEGEDKAGREEGLGGEENDPLVTSFPANCVAAKGEKGVHACNGDGVSLYQQNPQDGMVLSEAGKESDSLAIQKHFRGAWKDDWVITLIHARGVMDEDFMKSQRPGIDMWARVAMQISAAHMDFDKNSESCRKKWQRVYKSYRDDMVPGNGRHKACKWFDLVDHYMRVSSNSNAFAMIDEPTPLEDISHTDSPPVAHGDSLPIECSRMMAYANVTPFNSVHETILAADAHMGPPQEAYLHMGARDDCSFHNRTKARVKRTRRDQKIENSLAQMVETWKESLEVMKESEAKRIEILQTLSATMVGLLDVLRK